jgi:Flp pilus assembly protein TadD
MSQGVVSVQGVRSKIHYDSSLDSFAKEAAFADLERVASRDVAGACGESLRVSTAPNRAKGDYNEALRLTTVAARLAPWSAYCAGALGVVLYRSGDFLNALNAFERATALRRTSVSVEVAFRAMTLFSLGRSVEAAAAAAEFRAGLDQTDDDMQTVAAELAKVISGTAAPRTGF